MPTQRQLAVQEYLMCEVITAKHYAEHFVTAFRRNNHKILRAAGYRALPDEVYGIHKEIWLHKTHVVKLGSQCSQEVINYHKHLKHQHLLCPILPLTDAHDLIVQPRGRILVLDTKNYQFQYRKLKGWSRKRLMDRLDKLGDILHWSHDHHHGQYAMFSGQLLCIDYE